jgi:hypothetical protein
MQPTRPLEVNKDDPETKTEVPVMLTDAVHENDIISKFSTWNRAIRVIAWILRFKAASSKHKHASGALTLCELKIAEHRLLRTTQEAAFPAELLRVQKGQPVVACSQLASLSPKLHEDILVLGGRTPSWHRPILPSNSDLTTLIIRHHHSRQGHTGVEQALAALRVQWWIVHGRSAVRKVLRDCRICRR